jgi:glycosyltransferase involved in cell wall biosynthesis
MDKNNIGISVIFPTLNEGENLNKIIPEFVEIFEELNIPDYELIIVDDNSSDNTESLITKFSESNPKISLHVRENMEGSLPLSILKGIETSKKDYIMWLDADGSMTASAAKNMIIQLMLDNDSVIVGSRFIEGGGYKGVKDISSTSFLQAVNNVRNSNDSVFGMIFSIMFNKFLRILLSLKIHDLTSGFIIGRKSYFKNECFKNVDYGEYFLYVINDLVKKEINIKEIGYICETRKYGVSKTANTLTQLIKRGIPYIKVAILCRIENNGNKRS